MRVFGIEFDFEHTITRYIDDECTKEESHIYYVLVRGEFGYDPDEYYDDYNFTIHKTVNTDDFSDILRFLSPEDYTELEKAVEEKVNVRVEESIIEWREARII